MFYAAARRSDGDDCELCARLPRYYQRILYRPRTMPDSRGTALGALRTISERFNEGGSTMNKRGELKSKLEDQTEDEDVIDVVMDFINDMENQFNEIAGMLESVSISNLDVISDANDAAKSYGEELY